MISFSYENNSSIVDDTSKFCSEKKKKDKLLASQMYVYVNRFD